ncbi:Uncharacterised protein [Mycobacterium tuberculosis]|uniref:Uncharacterized protein n=1 Tax=Mycobacterium tuberculosis TaxID=1773 RepID=A0A0U0S8R4_MYCTX|nr:Uncharacterised protein [Mycobacterium tuberculosis]COX02523.1 Uncharacterised protein [Mycobacterium tuberculosis]
MIASIPATVRGPIIAPTWSSASCTAKPRPRPVTLAACDSRVSLAGPRTAFPTRSAMTNAHATHRAPAMPSSGTVTTVRV